MRRIRSKSHDEETLDITPMIDIVFIMLIFFIVTASFLKESGVDISRPGAVTQQQKSKATSILVQINDNGEIWIDKRLVDVRAVRANIERLRAENPEGSVVIQAGPESENGRLVKVIDAARLAGVENVSLSAAGG